MKKVLLLTAVLILLLGTTSCKKLLGLDAESLLTKNPWKGQKISEHIDGNFHTTVSIDYLTLDLEKDTHHYIFSSHGTVEREGRWSYDEDTEILTLDSDDGTMHEVFHILELDKHHLKFEFDFSAPNGHLYHYEVYYTHE